MKKFDFKSAAVGLLIGALGVTTAFAAGGIQSAEYSNTGVILNGQPLVLNTPLIAVTKDGEKNASMYMPVREIMESAGFRVTWNGKENVVVLEAPQPSANPNQSNSTPPAQPSSAPMNTQVVIDIASSDNKLVAQSGSFTAKQGQTLALTITSSIKGGTVDLFLFDPSGKEQKVTISGDMTKEISLSAGKWAYNCFGQFESGSVTILGTIEK